MQNNFFYGLLWKRFFINWIILSQIWFSEKEIKIGILLWFCSDENAQNGRLKVGFSSDLLNRIKSNFSLFSKKFYSWKIFAVLNFSNIIFKESNYFFYEFGNRINLIFQETIFSISHNLYFYDNSMIKEVSTEGRKFLYLYKLFIRFLSKYFQMNHFPFHTSNLPSLVSEIAPKAWPRFFFAASVILQHLSTIQFFTFFSFFLRNKCYRNSL